MTEVKMSSKVCLVLVLFSLAAGVTGARADDQKPLPSTPQGPTQSQPAASGGQQQGERLDVDRIRRNYWNRGEENDSRVVQNRLYSKAHKPEFGLFAGSISGDPFLTSKQVGFTAGFHFTEYLGLFGVFWKTFTTGSAALDFLEQQLHTTTNSNMPRDYKGTEVMWSPIYGKLSVLGDVIIHYDLHLLGGVGLTGNETGNNFTLSLGIGQQVYVNRHLALRVDYRLMRFDEGLIRKNPLAPDFGQVVLSRTNFSDVITAGIDVLF
jgi:outer membrane beta-barrel protein